MTDNQLFENWALDPKGGGWKAKPEPEGMTWIIQQRAFTAALAIGAQRERDKLRALVEGEIQSVSRGEIFMANTALQLVLNWLTAAPTTETDKIC